MTETVGPDTSDGSDDSCWDTKGAPEDGVGEGFLMFDDLTFDIRAEDLALDIVDPFAEIQAHQFDAWSREQERDFGKAIGRQVVYRDYNGQDWLLGEDLAVDTKWQAGEGV